MAEDPAYREGMLRRKAAENRDRKDRIRQMVETAKRGACVDCGRDDLPPEVLDMHHVRGTKRFGIGAASAYGLGAVADELAKCDRLCPTCHALRHFYARTLESGRFN